MSAELNEIKDKYFDSLKNEDGSSLSQTQLASYKKSVEDNGLIQLVFDDSGKCTGAINHPYFPNTY